MADPIDLHWTEGGAQLSPCLTYRLSLTRVWDRALPELCFVMFNPSTADGREDDPTIRKCIGFAKRWGYGSIIIVNLFTLRATDPRELRRPANYSPQDWQDYIRGPDRDAAIHGAVMLSDAVCVAWGAHPAAEDESREVFESGLLGERLFCIGRTKHGAPLHPLMARYTSAPEVYVG